MRARFTNGTFDVTKGMSISYKGYTGTVQSPQSFPNRWITHTEHTKAPPDPVRNLREEIIVERFYDVIVVALQEKTIGEFGLLNEFAVPVNEVIKI